jgi:hypothetical protein
MTGRLTHEEQQLKKKSPRNMEGIAKFLPLVNLALASHSNSILEGVLEVF